MQCLLKTVEWLRIFSQKATLVAINHIFHSNHIIILKLIHIHFLQSDVLELFLSIFRDQLSHEVSLSSSFSIPVLGSSSGSLASVKVLLIVPNDLILEH